MLFWSSFQYRNYVVINNGLLESDKFKMYFVSDIFLILPDVKTCSCVVILPHLSNVLGAIRIPSIRIVAILLFLNLSLDDVWLILQPYYLRCGLLQVWRP